MAIYSYGTGEPLLMVHGIISSGSFFEESARILGESFHVVAYDRRGYGTCAKPDDDDYSVGAQADDAARLIRDIDEGPMWVFGNSAGGLISVELALRYPELVRGLVLLEPSLVTDEESLAQIRAWNEELNSYVDEGRIKRALPAFARVVGEPEEHRKPSTLAQMRETFANLKNFMYGELNEVQHYQPTVARLSTINVPACVIVTRDGRDGMFGRTSEAGARALGWPIEFIDGYHNVARDNPTEFAARLASIVHTMQNTSD